MTLLGSRLTDQRPWIPVFILAGVALLLWIPAISTPWWGDDYLFLQKAFASRLGDEPWWAPFGPDIGVQFWRPLGHETYWRFVEGVLEADPWAARLSNGILWLLGCWAVALLGAALTRALSWDRPAVTGDETQRLLTIVGEELSYVECAAREEQGFPAP